MTTNPGDTHGASAGGVAAVVHKVADPAPLGLAAFAMTTFALSISNTNIWGPGADAALALALVYGGAAQLLAGMWEFRSGNTFGATAFSAFGAFWIGVYVFIHISIAAIVVGAPHGVVPNIGVALGLYLWVWTAFTVVMFIASLRTTGAVALVFLVLLVTFILLAIGNSGGSTSTIHLGGWFGIITAALAFYASGAGVINATWGKTVLPVFPLSS